MKNVDKVLFSVFALFGIIFISNAAGIQSLNVVAPSGGSTNLTISWDSLSNSVMSEFDGYALQWGASENKVRNVDNVQQFFNNSLTSASIRAADFEKGEYHYFRVYAYKVEGRLTTLAHGSRVLKWRWLSNGATEKEFVDAQDPVISTSSSADDRTLANVQVDQRDTYVGISWGSVDILSNEGYLIEISKNSDFSTEIAEYHLPRNTTKIRVDGFYPETDYYVRGSLYNSSKEKVGNYVTKDFKTLVTMSDDKKALIKRLKDRGMGAWVDKSVTNHSLENENTSATTASTSSSSTSTSTSATSTSTASTPSSSSSKKSSWSRSSKKTFFDFDPKVVTEKELNSALTELALMQNKIKIKNQIRKLRLQN